MQHFKLLLVALAAGLSVQFEPLAAQGDHGPWDNHPKPWEYRGQELPDYISQGKQATIWIHNEEVERGSGRVAYWEHAHFWVTQPNRVVYLLTRWELDCEGKARRTSQSGYDASGKSVLEIDSAQDWFFIRPNAQERVTQELFCSA